MNETSEKGGAGGNWKRLNERFDVNIVKQTSGVSCVAAIGEMLLKNRGIVLSQTEIIDTIGEPAYFARLADVLNRFDVSENDQKWYGVFVEQKSLEALFKIRNWAVILREPLEMGHAVLIDGKTKSGLIKIKDPFDQTSYKMREDDFLRHWNGEVIFYGRIK